MANDNHDFFVKIEVFATAKDSNPSYHYVNDFPAALAFVKAWCGETNITDFEDDWIELLSGGKKYLITKQIIDNCDDIRKNYPGKF